MKINKQQFKALVREALSEIISEGTLGLTLVNEGTVRSAQTSAARSTTVKNQQPKTVSAGDIGKIAGVSGPLAEMLAQTANSPDFQRAAMLEAKKASMDDDFSASEQDNNPDPEYAKWQALAFAPSPSKKI